MNRQILRDVALIVALMIVVPGDSPLSLVMIHPADWYGEATISLHDKTWILSRNAGQKSVEVGCRVEDHVAKHFDQDQGHVPKNKSVVSPLSDAVIVTPSATDELLTRRALLDGTYHFIPSNLEVRTPAEKTRGSILAGVLFIGCLILGYLVAVYVEQRRSTPADREG